jgi:RNA polymerase sigma factor (sigma-70 family)
MALMLETTSLAHTCSEPELINATRGGDDRAFEELYARYHDRIGAFIRGRVRDDGRAEDIAQEVFMSALRRLRASEQAISFKPWIYEIAKNACIDEFRRSQRTREVSLDADDELTGGPRALHAIDATPPLALDGKQRMQDLRGAFGGLSENHHKLLVMREFEGLSYNEIGRRTGMSLPTVESALFRARRKLTEEYEELASGRRCQQVQITIAAGRAQSARDLGARERRQMARHLAHCQPCRMAARLAGVDEALVRPRSIAAKIAALLPFPLPLWRWPWGSAARARNALVRGGSHPVVQQAQAATDSTGPAASLGGAAIAAAVIALAGAGGAVVSAVTHHARPGPARAGHVTVVGPRAASRQSTRPGAGAVSARASQPRAAAARRGGGAISAAGHAARPGASTSTSTSTSTAGRGAAHTGSAPAGAPSAGTPSVGSALRTASRAGGSASSLAKTASGTASEVTGGVVSTVHHVLNAVTGAASSTTSSLNNTLKSAVSTLGSTTSNLTSSVGSSAPTGSTPSSSSSTATTSTPSSPLSTVTGAVKQLASNLLH